MKGVVLGGNSLVKKSWEFTFFPVEFQVFLEGIPYITIIFLNAMIIKQIVTSGKFRKRFQRSAASTENDPGTEKLLPPDVKKIEIQQQSQVSKAKKMTSATKSYSDGIDKIGAPRSLRSLKRNKKSRLRNRRLCQQVVNQIQGVKSKSSIIQSITNLFLLLHSD